MQPRSSGDARHAYIPPDAQAAMSRQMGQGVPAHLQQYMGSGRPGAMPAKAQAELTSYMQKSMPEHLKQYAGAYVEQNFANPGAVQPRPVAPHAPIPDRLNLSHSGAIPAEQATVRFDGVAHPNDPIQPAAAAGPSPASEQPAPSQPNYDFIMNPPKSERAGLFSFGGNSNTSRLLAVAAGVLVLIILFTVIKGMLAGGNKALPDLIGVAQDQQELLHLTTSGAQNVTSTNLVNFTATAQASLASEQAQLMVYLKQAGHKLTAKQASLKISAAVDAQLAAAQSASTYEPTFTTAMQNALKTYQLDLKQAYAQEKGKVGRSMLSDDYSAASLLLKQLGS